MFESYKHAMYPYIEATGRQYKDQTTELLEEAFRQGPIVVQQMTNKEKYEVKDD